MNREPLHLVPVEKWPELQSVLASDWPRGLPGYNALETQSRWKKEGLEYGFKVYSIFGDMNNGYIAVNNKVNCYELIIQYPKDDTDVLQEVLYNTEEINWDTRIILAFAADHVVSAVQKVIKDKNIVLYLIPSYTFIIEKGSPSFEDVSLPADFTLELLSAKHAELIDSKWPHRYPSSTWYFQKLIDAKAGYGLFRNDVLACWILLSECGQLTHLFTMEEYRKQGLAELILKLVSNELLKVNIQVYAFCVQTNENACKLYNKIGFKRSNNVSWGFLYKRSAQNAKI